MADDKAVRYPHLDGAIWWAKGAKWLPHLVEYARAELAAAEQAASELERLRERSSELELLLERNRSITAMLVTDVKKSRLAMIAALVGTL